MHTLIVTKSAALIAALNHYTDTDGFTPAPVVASDESDGQEILSLLLKGWSCRAIANELGVSVPTVKARLMRLYRQTGTYRRSR